MMMMRKLRHVLVGVLGTVEGQFKTMSRTHPRVDATETN